MKLNCNKLKMQVGIKSVKYEVTFDLVKLKANKQTLKIVKKEVDFKLKNRVNQIY